MNKVFLEMLNQVPPQYYAIAAGVTLIAACIRVNFKMKWESGKLKAHFDFAWRFPFND